MNTYLDSAVEELELALNLEDSKKEQDLRTEKEIYEQNIYSVLKVPTIFEKVEYSPCVTIVDNR